MRKLLGKVRRATAGPFLHAVPLFLAVFLALFAAQKADCQTQAPWTLDQVVTNSGNGGPVTAPTLTPSQANEEAFLLIDGDYGGAGTSEFGPCNPEVHTYLTGISPPWSSFATSYDPGGIEPPEIGSYSILPGFDTELTPFTYWAATTAPISTTATVPWDTACISNDDWGTVLALVKYTGAVPITGPMIAGQVSGATTYDSETTNLSGWNFGAQPTFLVGYISWSNYASSLPGGITLSDSAGNSYQVIADVATSSGCDPEAQNSPPFCINAGTRMQMFISPNYLNPSGIVTVTTTAPLTSAAVVAVALGYPPCAFVPTTETTAFEGWDTADSEPTIGLWEQTDTDTNGDNFSGYQVQETSPTTGTDTCYFNDPNNPGNTPITSVTGGEWTISDNNTWSFDHVGLSAAAVAYYRANGRVPCSVTVYQQMQIQCPDGNWQNYGPVNTLQAIITATTVSSVRAGGTATRRY